MTTAEMATYAYDQIDQARAELDTTQITVSGRTSDPAAKEV